MIEFVSVHADAPPPVSKSANWTTKMRWSGSETDKGDGGHRSDETTTWVSSGGAQKNKAETREVNWCCRIIHAGGEGSTELWPLSVPTGGSADASDTEPIFDMARVSPSEKL
jgi:hypothetical protein